MGDISEKSYDYDASQSMASKNGYNINPIQQVIEEKSLEQTYKTGPNSVSITTGESNVVNEKYSIFSSNAKLQVDSPKHKNEVLYDKGIGVKELIQVLAGGKPRETVKRIYSTYRSENSTDKNSSTVLKMLQTGNSIGSGQHDYTNAPTVYRSWDLYSKSTNGKGALLKYRK